MSSDRHGLKAPAGIDFVPHSKFHHGRFGRLFRNLDPGQFADDVKAKEALTALGETMRDSSEPSEAGSGGGWRETPPNPDLGDNPNIPAGYTYLGQFIDHDITFDPASDLQRWNDPNALHNFRTPRFDLDSIYGEGRDDEPFLYDADTGKEKMLVDLRNEETKEFDLPRNSQGVALIGDPRNDENVVVSQLQVVFLRAHNKLVDLVGGFEEARRQLRWHYQYVVVNDFLRRIVPADVMSSVLPDGSPLEVPQLRFYGEEPYMPVEFSVAAYRFGHSMIRPIYDVNEKITDRPIFVLGSQPSDGQDLRGFQPLLPDWGVDWELFFELGSERPQSSRLIDVRLADGLRSLPGDPVPPSLAVRNLLRGRALGLPWGEAVAKRIGETPLTPAEVDLAGLGLDAQWQAVFESKTPLWFYVLREAQVRSQGLTLGPVGGRIVAETFLGLLANDPFSYPNIEPGWTPGGQGLIPQAGEKFEMADLVRFATT